VRLDRLRFHTGQQLRAGGGDVSPQDEQLRIENMQETHQRPSQIFKRNLEHATRAGIVICCRLKDGRRSRNSAGFVDGKPGRRSPVDVREIFGLDGSRGEVSFDTSAVAANAKAAVEVHRYVTEVAGGCHWPQRRITPSTSAAAPIPVPSVSMSTFSPPHAPRPKASRPPARCARRCRRRKAGRPFQPRLRRVAPSRKFRSPGRQLMRVVTGSITPLQPIPNPTTGMLALARTLRRKVSSAVVVRGDSSRKLSSRFPSELT